MGPKDQSGLRFSSPIIQLTATRTTIVFVTMASQQNRRPATSPGAITPMGESIGAVATATC